MNNWTNCSKISIHKLCDDWFSVFVLNLFHAWMLTDWCVLYMHKYWRSCLLRACALSKILFYACELMERLFFCMHNDWATLMHASWRSDLFCACLLKERFFSVFSLKERLVLWMLIEGATCFEYTYWRSDFFWVCLLKERLVLSMLIEGATCFEYAYWRKRLFFFMLTAHHVTRLNTPIHNILSTSPQLSISQVTLGTLPEDGNIMPKHVGATIYN
jgi:hypothetical protein